MPQNAKKKEIVDIAIYAIKAKVAEGLANEIHAPTKNDFPITGETGKIYIDDSTFDRYVWNPQTNTYDEIKGASAFSELAGIPNDNAALAQALNSKASNTDLTQEIQDRQTADAELQTQINQKIDLAENATEDNIAILNADGSIKDKQIKSSSLALRFDLNNQLYYTGQIVVDSSSGQLATVILDFQSNQTESFQYYVDNKFLSIFTIGQIALSITTENPDQNIDYNVFNNYNLGDTVIWNDTILTFTSEITVDTNTGLALDPQDYIPNWNDVSTIIQFMDKNDFSSFLSDNPTSNDPVTNGSLCLVQNSFGLKDANNITISLQEPAMFVYDENVTNGYKFLYYVYSYSVVTNYADSPNLNTTIKALAYSRWEYILTEPSDLIPNSTNNYLVVLQKPVSGVRSIDANRLCEITTDGTGLITEGGIASLVKQNQYALPHLIIDKRKDKIALKDNSGWRIVYLKGAIDAKITIINQELQKLSDKKFIDLPDVDKTGLQDGDFFVYDGASGKMKPEQPANNSSSNQLRNLGDVWFTATDSNIPDDAILLKREIDIVYNIADYPEIWKINNPNGFPISTNITDLGCFYKIDESTFLPPDYTELNPAQLDLAIGSTRIGEVKEHRHTTGEDNRYNDYYDNEYMVSNANLRLRHSSSSSNQARITTNAIQTEATGGPRNTIDSISGKWLMKVKNAVLPPSTIIGGKNLQINTDQITNQSIIDFAVTNPEDGNTIVYNSTSQNWEAYDIQPALDNKQDKDLNATDDEIAIMSGGSAIGSGRTFGNDGTNNTVPSSADMQSYVQFALLEVPNLPVVDFATTGNITAFSGLAAIDGYTPVAGKILLVKNQTNLDNGIWKVNSGAWIRQKYDSNTNTWVDIDINDIDYDNLNINGGIIANVLNGVQNANLRFQISITNPSANIGSGGVNIRADLRLGLKNPTLSYVDKNIGNDTNNIGNAQFPWFNISKVLNTAGQTYPHVINYQGSSTENITLASSKSNITIQASDASKKAGKQALGTITTQANFTRLTLKGITVNQLNFGANDLGRHSIEDVIINNASAPITFDASFANWIDLYNIDVSLSSNPNARITLPARASGTATINVNQQKTFLPFGTIGAGWNIIIRADVGIGSCLFFDRPPNGTVKYEYSETQVQDIINTEAKLTALLADYSSTTDGLYLMQFTSIPNYASGVNYVVGNVVLNASDNRLYRCAIAHFSGSTIDITKFIKLAFNNTDIFLKTSYSGVANTLTFIAEFGNSLVRNFYNLKEKRNYVADVNTWIPIIVKLNFPSSRSIIAQNEYIYNNEIYSALNSVTTTTTPDKDNVNFIRLGVPVGTLTYLPQTTSPTGYLLLNGTTYNKADYPYLWAWAVANTLTTTNAASYTFFLDVSGTQFKVPDLRGYFIRTRDGRATGSIDSVVSRNMLTIQADSVLSHSHSIYSEYGNVNYSGGGNGFMFTHPYANGVASRNTNSAGGAENLVKNIASNLFIKI